MRNNSNPSLPRRFILTLEGQSRDFKQVTNRMPRIYTFRCSTTLQSSNGKWVFRLLKNKTLEGRLALQFYVWDVCKSAKSLRNFMTFVWTFLQKSISSVIIVTLGLNEINERLRGKRRISRIKSSSRKIEGSWKLRRV